MAESGKVFLFFYLFIFYKVAVAGPASLSGVPMITSDEMRPNIMLLLDSSGSMAWDMNGRKCKLAEDELSGCIESYYGGWKKEWRENISPYPQQRIIAAKVAAKSLVDRLSFVRLGYATFDATGSGDGGELIHDIVDLDDMTRAEIKTAIDNTWANGGTPLSLSLEGLGQYFSKRKESATSLTRVDNSVFKDKLINDTNNAGASEVIQSYCQKNFIIAMTDGEPNKQSAVSAEIQNYDRTKTDVGGGDWSRFFASDVVHKLYDTDFRPDLTDPRDPQHINNVVTYLIGFADPSVYAETTTTGKLLRDAATGDPTKSEGGEHYKGRFYPTADQEALDDAFSSIAADITNQVGSSTSVAFNSSTIQTDSEVFFAKFNTVDWSGDLASYAINSDGSIETTATWTAASQLDALSDTAISNRVIYTYYDISLYPRNTVTESLAKDGRGVVFSGDNLTEYQREDFTAGKEQDSGYSMIDYISYIRGSRSSEQQSGGLLRNRSTRLGDIVNSAPTYVGVTNMWPATMTSGTSGDYSDFQRRIASRRAMVYVGANDGMLHGFDASTGEEKFAYIPASVYRSEAEEGLHYYADPDYKHRFYVDLSSSYADVVTSGTWKSILVGGNRAGGRSIFALDVTDPAAFIASNSAANQVVLWEFTHPDMGASYSRPQLAQMNNGRWAAIFGNGYNRDDNEGHDGVAKLFIVYLDADPSDGWAMGNTSVDDYLVLSTEVGSSANNLTRNGLSTPRLYDVDGNTTVDRIFAGDINGNMWVWDVSSMTTSEWGSAYHNITPQPLYRGEATAPITTQPIILYNSDVVDSAAATLHARATVEAASAAAEAVKRAMLTVEISEAAVVAADIAAMAEESTELAQVAADARAVAVTAIVSLDAARAAEIIAIAEVEEAAAMEMNAGTSMAAIKSGSVKNLIVLFGTGQFITAGDKQTTNSNYFMGVYDNGVGGITRSKLTDRRIAVETENYRNISRGSRVDWELNKGWVLTLPSSGERMVTRPFLRHSVVFFNTMIPDSQPCSSGGTGWQMRVEALDGLDPEQSAFDTDSDGVVTGDDTIYAGKVFLNGIPADTAILGDKSYTPGSKGELPEPEVMRSLSGAMTRLSWGEIFRTE